MERKGNVTALVAAYIKQNIRNGNWILGEKIPSENTLCKELNVSRVSVRSALQQFIAQGVLESIHGKGTYLRSVNLTDLGIGKEEMQTQENTEEICALLEFRSMLEPQVCEAVARTASPELIAKMSEYLNEMEKSKDDNETFVENDIKFHMSICEELHNPILVQVMSDIFEKRRETYKLLRVVTGYYGGVYYHSLLLDAFRKQDGKRAKILMKEHLERGIMDVSLDSEDNADSHG